MCTKYLTYLFCFVVIPCMASAQGVNIDGGLQVVAQGNIYLVIDQGGLKNDGVFTPGNSTVFFDGGATTAITGSQPVPFYNLTFRGSGTKVNMGNTSVIGTFAVEGTTVADADGVANDKSFTLRSSDTATARVAILTTGDITGNVTVERFINTGTGAGQHAKSWQFLSTPATGQTFFQSWQEGGLVPPGYGTRITGTGTGFDAVTLLPSLKFYNTAGANWTGISTTSGSLQNKLGYMLFVRGDRTVTTFNGTPNNTNMRSKGVLFTPSNPPPTVPVTANQFQTFGNPYASRIEFNKVFLASTGINDVFYAWDPKLNGSYNVGGYQTISGVAGYIPTAGNSTAYYPAGVPSPFIESGQAVFVRGNGTGGNVGFNENIKVAGSRLVNRGGESELPFDRQLLFTTLFTNTGVIADGNIVAFENGLGNELNTHDAEKIFNEGENFGIRRDEKILAVEARDAIMISDTIFYHFGNLRQQAYQLRFAPLNMSAGLSAFLIDRFSNSSTDVSLSDSTFIDFTIGAEAGSNAPGRFILVFRQATVVPVRFVYIAAGRNSDRSNEVTWKVENEINLRNYVLERSGNGSAFDPLSNSVPTGNNGGTVFYRYRDANPLADVNYYRVKAISNSGTIQYSAIVKVELKHTSDITIYPNPVKDKAIHIRYNNQSRGNYTIRLSNELGQVILTNSFYIDQANVVQTIRADIAAGTYQLSIIKEDGSKVTEQLFVQ